MGIRAVEKIVVHVKVGNDRMAGTADPCFLRLIGPAGREFRLAPTHGRSMRRHHEETFVLASPSSQESTVAHPELNDPRQPALDLEGIERVSFRKGQEPIPNVRGLGEMDDRVLLELIAVEIHAEGLAAPIRFERTGPIWLGLVCGLEVELKRVDGGS